MQINSFGGDHLSPSGSSTFVRRWLDRLFSAAFVRLYLPPFGFFSLPQNIRSKHLFDFLFASVVNFPAQFDLRCMFDHVWLRGSLCKCVLSFVRVCVLPVFVLRHSLCSAMVEEQ